MMTNTMQDMATATSPVEAALIADMLDAEPILRLAEDDIPAEAFEDFDPFADLAQDEEWFRL